MSISNNSNSSLFFLVIPLIVQLLIIFQSFSLIDCLSLTELHSTLPSNHHKNHNNYRLKSRLAQEKSIRDNLRSLNHLHRKRLSNNNNNNYDLTVDEDFDQSGLPVINDLDYDLQANLPNYVIVKPTINGISKRQDEVVMDIPLEYTSDIPYEFYPELWPSNKQRSVPFHAKNDDNDLTSSDILSQVLAAKIADLLESQSQAEHNSKRKRVLVKRNHRSGLPSGGAGFRSRPHRVSPHFAPKPSPKSSGNTKPTADSKHRSSGHDGGKDGKVTSRKLEDTKKDKLNRIPLKSTLASHQPVKGDFAKLVNGKAVHVSSLKSHPKVLNSTHKDSDKNRRLKAMDTSRKIEGKHRNPTLSLDRKEKPLTAMSSSLAHQKSMKEFFNEIDLPNGPKNVAKRSISSRLIDDDLMDLRQEAVDGYNSKLIREEDDDEDDDNRRDVDDIASEIGENELRSAIGHLPSSTPEEFQSNPWLVDEATRTLMRSLTVKRRKRGNDENEEDQLALIGLDDGDLTTTAVSSTSSNDKDADEDGNPDNSNVKSNKIDMDQLRVNEMDETAETRPMITGLIDFSVVDEIPARIVKKDGVTLTEGQTEDEDDNINRNNQQKRLESKSNGSQTPKAITSFLDGVEPENDTFFEEEFSTGLLAISDLDDLDKINKSVSLDSLINMDEEKDDQKKRSDSDGKYSSSTLPPTSVINEEEEGKLTINGLIDDQVVNGSVDDQLLIETINKGLYAGNKRKRSVTSVAPYFGEVGGPVSALVAQEAARFTDVDDKLERIEETLILEALDLIKGNLNGENGQSGVGEGAKHRIESRLNAAYDLEDMRLALTDLHKTMQKISTEDEDEDGGEPEPNDLDRNNDHGNEIDDGPEAREIYLDTVDKISGKLRSDDEEQDLKGDSGLRNRDIGRLSISPPLNNYQHQTITKNHHSNSDNLDECPAIRVLTTDCSTVKDVVPYGPLQKIFGKACNWHEVCYSCGELFGLLSSDCDMGFLERSRLACNDSASCETASRLILMPLKSRRTFYKQKVPPMCYQQPCVESFLLKSRRKR